MTILKTDEQYDEHIRPGIAVLDHEKPGWEFVIDLERLDMMDSSDCLLGQLYGDWSAGLSATFRYRQTLPLEDQVAAHTVFADHTGGPVDRAWRREIERRRAAA